MPKSGRAPAPVMLSGRVVSFNVSPKGHVEGALIETKGKIAQVNFPKHDAGASAKHLVVGRDHEFRVEPADAEGDHPVYQIVEDEGALEGKIARLNYTLHGEVNGCILEDGTFVHLKPEGAKKHKLRVGEAIRATGKRRAGADTVVVEASEVEKLEKPSGKKAAKAAESADAR